MGKKVVAVTAAGYTPMAAQAQNMRSGKINENYGGLCAIIQRPKRDKQETSCEYGMINADLRTEASRGEFVRASQGKDALDNFLQIPQGQQQQISLLKAQ